MRSELRIITLASLLVPAGLAQAQFSTLELVNETDERLILDPTFEYLNLEKDITWGDFDNDGDIDVAVAMKFVGSIEGGWPNLLLMNENGVLTDRTDQFATSSDLAGDDGFAAPSNDRNVEAMDVNNDGFLDLVTATTMSDDMDWTLGQPRVHLNLGNDQNGNWLGFRHEHLRIPEMFAINGSVANPRFCDIAWADFNGDGKLDVHEFSRLLRQLREQQGVIHGRQGAVHRGEVGLLPCDLIIVDKAIRKACLAVCKVEFVHSDEALQG